MLPFAWNHPTLPTLARLKSFFFLLLVMIESSKLRHPCAYSGDNARSTQKHAAIRLYLVPDLNHEPVLVEINDELRHIGIFIYSCVLRALRVSVVLHCIPKPSPYFVSGNTKCFIAPIAKCHQHGADVNGT